MVRRRLLPSLTLAPWLGVSLIVGCAGTPLGESMQESLGSDPQLEENPAFGQASPEADAPEATPAPNTASTPETTAQTSNPDRARVSQPPADRLSASTTDPTAAPPTPPARSAARDTTLPSDVLEQTPEELQSYLVDLRALGLLQKSAEGDHAATLQPNQPVSRAQYAQWLLATNNYFYSDQPDKRIRPGVGSSQPVFADVPPSHPAFAAIQGLAEAGIIPSPLSGQSTTVNFRPDAPLTRKDLVLWKVPLDTHAALPSANAAAITETWGFQDATKIEPLAQRAVLADHQNGEFANIRRTFGYTTLFQPDKAVTEAEAAATLWRFGSQTEGISAQMLRQRSGSAMPKAPAEAE